MLTIQTAEENTQTNTNYLLQQRVNRKLEENVQMQQQQFLK